MNNNLTDRPGGCVILLKDIKHKISVCYVFLITLSLNYLGQIFNNCQLMFKMLAAGVLVASCIFAAAESLHIPTPTVSIKRGADSVSQNTPANITPTQSVGPDGYFITTQHITIEGVTNDHVTVAGQTIDIAIPTCIQTITPDANGYVPPGTCGAIWDYYPNFPAALIFACIFGILTMVHLWQAIANRKVRLVKAFFAPNFADSNGLSRAEILLGHHHGEHLGNHRLYFSRH